MRALAAVSGALALAMACAATACNRTASSSQTKPSAAASGGTSATAPAQPMAATDSTTPGASTASGAHTESQTAKPAATFAPTPAANSNNALTKAKPVTHQATGTVVSVAATQIVVTRQFGRNKVNWTFVVNAKTKVEGKPAKAMRVRVYYHDDKPQHVAERVRIVEAAPASQTAGTHTADKNSSKTQLKRAELSGPVSESNGGDKSSDWQLTYLFHSQT